MNWPATIRALEAAGCTLTPEGRRILEGVPEPRDYSYLFQSGRCVICNQPRTENGEEAHAAMHLAHATAITDTARGVTRVVPNVPVAVPLTLPADFYRRVDPKLRRLALGANRRARKRTT